MIRVPDDVKLEIAEFGKQCLPEQLRAILSEAILPDEYQDQMETLALLIPEGQTEGFYLGMVVSLISVATMINELPSKSVPKMIGAFLAAIAIRHRQCPEEEKWELSE